MENLDSNLSSFSIVLDGELQSVTPLMSKARARIFYKGENRNGGFITDEFADKLISTIAYAPVKGIFDIEDVDYTDHGTKRTEGRIYGVVPENPNFSWEKHTDEDGVARDYACVDVILYTALYEEAKLIVGKSLSMELYRPSIKGDWAMVNGKRLYKYSDASFLGLQVLGTDVEPCFEGAAFFSLYTSLKAIVDKLEEYTNISQKEKDCMENLEEFSLSHEEIRGALFKLLNPNFNEAGGYQLDYYIDRVYDTYALVCSAAEEKYFREYYNLNQETRSLEISSQEEAFIIDVTTSEFKALEALRAINGDTFEKIDENMVTVATLEEKSSEFSTKIEELNNSIATLTTERDNANTQISDLNTKLEEAATQYSVAQETIGTLTEEKDALSAFKKKVEDESKQAVINNYTDDLGEDVIAQFTSNLDNYTAEELDIKLTYELKKAHPEYFQKHSANPVIPVSSKDTNEWDSILGRYEK